MSLLKIGIAALAAAVLVTGCDRAVTRIFSPYENDSRNVKRIGTAVGSPIYRIVDDDMKCVAIFTPQGDSARCLLRENGWNARKPCRRADRRFPEPLSIKNKPLRILNGPQRGGGSGSDVRE